MNTQVAITDSKLYQDICQFYQDENRIKELISDFNTNIHTRNVIRSLIQNPKYTKAVQNAIPKPDKSKFGTLAHEYPALINTMFPATSHFEKINTFNEQQHTHDENIAMMDYIINNVNLSPKSMYPNGNSVAVICFLHKLLCKYKPQDLLVQFPQYFNVLNACLQICNGGTDITTSDTFPVFAKMLEVSGLSVYVWTPFSTN